MLRSRLLICLLLVFTSMHVLVTDSFAHAHEHPPGTVPALVQGEVPASSHGLVASASHHCCQCQGVMTLRLSLMPPQKPSASHGPVRTPGLPLAPLFEIDRPPIVS